MILSSSPRSSHTPRHWGQKSISIPSRLEIDRVTSHTGHCISSRLVPCQAPLDAVRGRRGLGAGRRAPPPPRRGRSDEHTSELQSLMRISYAVFCLKKQKDTINNAMLHSTTTHIQSHFA